MSEGIGDKFQRDTRYDPDDLKGHHLDWSSRPKQLKEYGSSISVVSLPQPEFEKSGDIWNLLLKRRSRRVYEEPENILLKDLSVLLWATQGVTARHGDYLFRTAPSAGALYPVETYVLVRRVEGVDSGIYHFRPDKFDLELLNNGDKSRELAFAALSQGMIVNAQVTFIWTAVVERSKWKYRQRAYRYIYLDAGHIAQNLYLAGEALGLGICAIGAFFDNMVNDLLGLDGDEETVIYMATCGLLRKKKGGEFNGSSKRG